MAEVNCVVVTPEETFLETKTDFVALPLFDGEIGILPGHSPMIGRLGFGEMRLGTGSQTNRFYLDGGFVQVSDNLVSVLTQRALSADKIDAEAAKEQLQSARSRAANSAADLEIRDRLIAQARSQLRMSRRDA